MSGLFDQIDERSRDSDVKRVFLNWDGPVLARAVAHFARMRARVAGTAGRGRWDLSGLVVVTPGGRAGRLLLAMLAQRARADGVMLHPPTVVTPDGLAGAVGVVIPNIASATMTHLAWCEAIERLWAQSPEVLEPLMPGVTELDARRVGASARLIERTHSLLAGHGIRFDEALIRLDRFGGFSEHARWEALVELEAAYVLLLGEASVVDRHLETRRRLESIDTGSIAAHVVLLGVSELSGLARRAVDFAAQCTALIAAPESMGEQFDRLGCVSVDHWAEHVVVIPDDHVHFAEDPGDQAAIALECISRAGVASVDDVSIGVADSSVMAPLMRRLDAICCSGHLPDGVKVSRSHPGVLLATVLLFLDDHTFINFASVARHPDIERLFGRPLADDGERVEYWIRALDTYQEKHLVHRISGEIIEDPEDKRNTAKKVSELHTQFSTLLGPLMQGGERRLDEQAKHLREFFDRVYGKRKFDPQVPDDQHLVRACEAIAQVLDAFGGVAAAVWSRDRRVSASAAIGMLLEQLAQSSISREAKDNSIDLLGWLELALDPAPCVVVTGMNEGFVPASSMSDPFLPDQVRGFVGIPSSRDRLARDVYLCELIQRAHEHTDFISGRITNRNDPIQPSRLLLGESGLRLVDRVRRFTRDLPAVVSRVGIIEPESSADGSFLISVPEATHEIDRMSVTWFKDYISSPRTFYLKHVLGLKEVEDERVELAPSSFGTLVHEVLDRFAKDEVARDLRSPEKILSFLEHAAEVYGRETFGAEKSTSLEVQLRFARDRLEQFAQWQAEQRKAGWKIQQAEELHEAPLDVDGVPITIRGRIDRIDVHEQGDRVRIIDFKTSKKVDVDKSHRTRGAWKNLQLPLYWHMMLPKFGEAEIQVGYVIVPPATKPTDWQPAKWDRPTLDGAIEQACRVVRDIRAGRFDAPGDPSRWRDIFTVLCGHEYLVLDTDDDEEGDDS